MSEEFRQQFTGSSQVIMANQQEFIGAESGIYADQQIEADKLPAIFNGNLPYACILPEGDPAIYAYSGIAGSSFTGEPVAVRTSFSGECLILGFPLYYCYEAGVAEFMAEILQEFEGSSADPDQITAHTLRLTAFPNPFSPLSRTGITVSYDLGKAEQGKLSIYNLKGQKLSEVILRQNKGDYIWNAADNISSGVYFLQLISNESQLTKKTLILK
jgi:hypothetical protein